MRGQEGTNKESLLPDQPDTKPFNNNTRGKRHIFTPKSLASFLKSSTRLFTTPVHVRAGTQQMTRLASLLLLPLACSAFVLPNQPTRHYTRAIQVNAEGEEAPAAPEWRGGQAASAVSKDIKTVFKVEDIANILPHRYPFALVDKVIEFEPGKRAVGIKQITNNEPQFTGHFPNKPIMPGVMMIEALAQLGGVLCLQPPVSDGKGLFFFAGIDGVKFRRPVVPGDTLVMEVELIKFMEKFGIAKLSAKAYVDGQVAVEAKELTFAIAKNA